MGKYACVIFEHFLITHKRGYSNALIIVKTVSPTEVGFGKGYQAWLLGGVPNNHNKVLINKFLDQSTPSLRNGHDGEKMGKKCKKKIRL